MGNAIEFTQPFSVSNTKKGGKQRRKKTTKLNSLKATTNKPPMITRRRISDVCFMEINNSFRFDSELDVIYDNAMN